MALQNAAQPDPPAESSGGKGSRLFIWLVVLSLALLFLPLFLIGNAVKEDGAALAVEVESLQATLEASPRPDAEVETLEAELMRLRTQSVSMEAFATGLVEAHIDWPAVMEILSNYDQGRLSFSELVQNGNRLTLTGQAVDEAAVMSYAQRLRESPYFEAVTVQAISLTVLPTAIPTPPNQAQDTPMTASLNPTPLPPGTVAEFTLLVDLRANVQ